MTTAVTVPSPKRTAKRPKMHHAAASIPSPKPSLAMCGAGSCGGCDISVVNLHEKIRELADVFDVVFWPTIMDVKYRDVEAMPDASITLTFFSGGLRTSEDVELAELMRRKSRHLVAFGSCASEGCIPGLANLTTSQQLLDTAFTAVSMEKPDGVRPQITWKGPEGVLSLPLIEPLLRTLDQVVAVDWIIPGCPPQPRTVYAALQLLVPGISGDGPLPPIGSVLGAGRSTVCDECARRRDVRHLTHFVRLQELDPASIDPDVCLLEQGLPCNGPATRDGCGALCPIAGAACIGCYGPSEGVTDAGARLISAYASIMDARDPAEIERILDGIPDPVGQFYRFGLAHSLLRSGRAAWKDGMA